MCKNNIQKNKPYALCVKNDNERIAKKCIIYEDKNILHEKKLCEI